MSNPRIGNGNGNGTSQACAACKYQRRKCAPDCILAPYFPHDRQRQFLNAHKLFGVSNITKIIKNLNQTDKDEAMRTIIFQSDVRANDPVGGCYRIIRELQRQIEYHKAELDLVLHQLAICRAQAQQQTHFQMLETDDSTTLGCEILNPDSLDVYDPTMIQYHYPQTQEEEEQGFVIQDHNQKLQENVDEALPIQDSTSSPSLHDFKQHFVKECDDIKPLLDINDVKFEPEELVERQLVPLTQLVISS
ncbi:LOB domain-containing protein 22 isoform X1 [Manihot esculenta]|uniref:LOB domain-containing protein n=1 Tax=Manihot esculenta TaxID=3983 RepID=A0A2C9UXW9_MANES|nr:LOB domain-containing protein 22 isoform X1 [Manihot esculenta]XP_043817885.1 LOB domain-containing protein 22 isoform X1 [Manihot esculenta]OAY36504.1 hypothetical protein MANES_11G026000v8 [Manihot esculenta]